MKKILSVLVITALGLFLKVSAVKLTIDRPIKLSPEQPSQTILIGLDEIPLGLIKKDGTVPRKFFRAKFKFKVKVAKSLFEIKPKNGKIKIQVKDGRIIPGELTITAKDPNTRINNEEWKLKIRKKIAEKLNIEPLEGAVEVGDMVTIAGTVSVPTGELDKFNSDTGSSTPDPGSTTPDPGSSTPDPGSSTGDPGSSTGRSGRRFQTPIDEGTTVTINSRTAEVQPDGSFRITNTPVGTGTTNANGQFEIEIPSEFYNPGTGLSCSASSRDGNTTINSFIYTDPVVVDPSSNYLFDIINNNNMVNPGGVSVADLTNVARRIPAQVNTSVGTLDSISSAIDERVGRAINIMLENIANTGNATTFATPPNSDVTKTFSTRISSGLAFINTTPEQGQIIGQALIVDNNVFRFNYNNASRSNSKTKTQDEFVFGTTWYHDHALGINAMSAQSNKNQGNEFFNFTFEDLLEDQPELPIIASGARNKNCQDTFVFVPPVLDGNFCSTVNPYLVNSVVAPNTGVTIGGPQLYRTTDKIDDVPVGIFDSVGVDLQMDKLDLKGVQPLVVKFEENEPWEVAIGMGLDDNGGQTIESVFAECDTGKKKDCEGDLFKLLLKPDSTGRYGVSSEFFVEDTATLEGSGTQNRAMFQFQWSESTFDRVWSNPAPEDGAQDFSVRADLHVRFHAAIDDDDGSELNQTTPASKASSATNYTVFPPSSFNDYVGTYEIHGYGFEFSPTSHSIFQRSGNMDFSLVDGSPRVAYRDVVDTTSTVSSNATDIPPAVTTVRMPDQDANTAVEGRALKVEANAHDDVEVQNCVPVNGGEVFVCRFYDQVLDDAPKQDNITVPVHTGIFFAVRKYNDPPQIVIPGLKSD